MKVVVTIIMVNFIYGTNEDLKDVRVRKCPPNYKPQEGEFVVELEDYTEDDIKEYFEKPQIWGRRHEDPEKEQWIKSNASLMHEEDV